MLRLTKDEHGIILMSLQRISILLKEPDKEDELVTVKAKDNQVLFQAKKGSLKQAISVVAMANADINHFYHMKLSRPTLRVIEQISKMQARKIEHSVLPAYAKRISQEPSLRVKYAEYKMKAQSRLETLNRIIAKTEKELRK